MAAALLARLTRLAEPAIKSFLPKALRFLGKPKLARLATSIDQKLLKGGLREFKLFGLKGNNQFVGQGPANEALRAFRGAVQAQHAKYPLARSFHGG